MHTHQMPPRRTPQVMQHREWLNFLWQISLHIYLASKQVPPRVAGGARRGLFAVVRELPVQWRLRLLRGRLCWMHRP